MTQLIGVVKGPTLRAAKEQIAKAQPLADLVEIRLDLFEPQALKHLDELPRDLPMIFTFRKKSQGGARELTEHERCELFEKCLKQGKPAYCDIEADTELAFFDRVHELFPKMHIIGSFHDLNGVPEHLDQQLERMHKQQIAHYKIAVQAQSTNDALKVMDFAKGKPHLTCIAMGPDGAISRILAPIIGSEFCYAAIEEADAPLGQLDLKTLSEIYRFKTLTPKTKIYALLGDPVDQSIGHLFHNQTFGKGAVYVKLTLDEPELPLFFSLMRQLPFAGFSITMPLKERLKRFMTRYDPAAETIGSVNTILIEEEHFTGYNTDGAGALNVLEKRGSVKGKRIALLGAGGTARAIAYEAIQRGASVVALNRTLARAEKLSQDLGCGFGCLEDLVNTPYDILINTAPVDLLFDPQSLRPDAIVMDIIYWEAETPLLQAAKKRGCQCIGGIEMFEEQARLQQEIWFKK